MIVGTACSRSSGPRSREAAASQPCPAEKSGQPASASTSAVRPVSVEMRNVVFRDDPASVLRIQYFKGSLIPTNAGVPPSFDDKHSFVFGIDSATILTSMADMTTLLNGSVFNYEHALLTNIKLSAKGSKLWMTATLHKGVPVPIEMLGVLGVTQDGKMSVSGEKIQAAHVPIKKAMKALDIQMADLVDPKYARGVSVVGNTLVLDPRYVFPPPYKEGRLTQVGIDRDYIVQTFGSPADAHAKAPDANMTNGIRLRGGSVRFGKLEMHDADVIISDAQPKTWFDFYLDQYHNQLASSDIKITPNQQLRVYMPDRNGRGSRGVRSQASN